MEQSEQLWEYIDGSYTNCEDVAAELCISHPGLEQKVCGPLENK